MKKFLAILLAVVIGAAMVACTETEKGASSTVYEEVDLMAVADSLYDGIAEDNRPFVMSMPLTEEDFEFFTFIPYEEGLEAVANEPMMGSIAHSIVLVKCPTAEKAAEVASAMKENCNPRKWVCVEADKVTATTNGNIAMLLMTTTEGGMSDTIVGNFGALDAEKIALLKSEPALEEEFDIEEPAFEDEYLFEGEVEAEGEDVVFEYDEEFTDDTPAAMPEEAPVDVMPAV